MAFPSDPRVETYDSNTPSGLPNRTSTNGTPYRRSSKGTTIQSYRGQSHRGQSHRGSILNSSVHTTSPARTDLFQGPGQGFLHPISYPLESPSGHGNCPTISDRKSFHHLGKSIFTSRNQSPSTETTRTYQTPISRLQDPISRPQDPISRPRESVSLPEEPISRSQEPISRPQATTSNISEQPIYSRTYPYALEQPPPPAAIPVSFPSSHAHRSRTLPPQLHHVVYNTHEAPIVTKPPAMGAAPPSAVESASSVRDVRIPHSLFLIQVA